MSVSGDRGGEAEGGEQLEILPKIPSLAIELSRQEERFTRSVK